MTLIVTLLLTRVMQTNERLTCPLVSRGNGAQPMHLDGLRGSRDSQGYTWLLWRAPNYMVVGFCSRKAQNHSLRHHPIQMLIHQGIFHFKSLSISPGRIVTSPTVPAKPLNVDLDGSFPHLNVPRSLFPFPCHISRGYIMNKQGISDCEKATCVFLDGSCELMSIDKIFDCINRLTFVINNLA